MAKGSRLFEAGFDNVSTKRWRRRANSAHEISLGQLKKLDDRARNLRQYLDTVLRESDERLSFPRAGEEAQQLPRGTDWSWRADAWRWRADQKGLAFVGNGWWIAPGLQLFHDCPDQEISVRQLRNKSNQDLSPYAIRLDVLNFSGSFLSIAMDLPDSAVKDLRKSHLVRLDTWIESEQPLEIYARLNVQHGPNTEQMVRELSGRDAASWVEFDLDAPNLNESRIERMWVDLIFNNPSMNMVTIREFSFSRNPRAEL